MADGCNRVQTVALNGLTNVELIDCALSNDIGTVQLHCHGTPELNTIQRGTSGGASCVDVRMTTLDKYAAVAGLDLQKIRFVKIDGVCHHNCIDPVAFVSKHLAGCISQWRALRLK